MQAMSVFSVPNPRHDPHLRLFCFPHAGGAAHAFRWEEELPDSVEVCVYNPPGRGARLSDPIHETWDAVVAEVLTEIIPHTDVPFAFLGHSMGCYYAFELAKELRRQKLRLPIALIMSAAIAPQLPHSQDMKISTMPADEFLDVATNRWGFIPKVISCRHCRIKTVAISSTSDIIDIPDLTRMMVQDVADNPDVLEVP